MSTEESVNPSKLIYTFDVNIFGFLMNPDNAILIMALVAFLIGVSMNFLIAGSIIAIALVLFYFQVINVKSKYEWPSVKTLCPDQYQVKERVMDQMSGRVSRIICTPMYPNKIKLGSAMNSQNPDFDQAVKDTKAKTQKNACMLASGMGLEWEACN